MNTAEFIENQRTGVGYVRSRREFEEKKTDVSKRHYNEDGE